MRTIVFEGIDASGKETQIKLLEKYLIGKGFKVRSVSFPRYDNPIGDLIGRGLRGEIDISPKALHLLYEVDRLDFMEEVTIYKQEGVDFLLIDRYTLSNLVYCTANNLSIDFLQSVIDLELVHPDMMIFLDITVDTSFKRRTIREDNFESSKEFLEEVRRLYNRIDCDEYINLKVDNLSVESVSKLVNKSINQFFMI